MKKVRIAAKVLSLTYIVLWVVWLIIKAIIPVKGIYFDVYLAINSLLQLSSVRALTLALSVFAFCTSKKQRALKTVTLLISTANNVLYWVSLHLSVAVKSGEIISDKDPMLATLPYVNFFTIVTIVLLTIQFANFLTEKLIERNKSKPN